MKKPNNKLSAKLQIIIFDIDRTLAKITNSYEDSIRGAVATYLELLGLEIIREKELVKEKELYPLWQRPELSDVWYLTYAAAAYYLSQLIINNIKLKEKYKSLPNIPVLNISDQLTEFAKIKTLMKSNKINYKFSEFIPLLEQAAGKDKIEIIRNATETFFENNKADKINSMIIFDKLWSTNLLKSFFQHMFMDKDAYQKEYGEKYGNPLQVYREDWTRDQTIIDPKELRQTLGFLKSQGYGLGIATARPESELKRFLKVFDLNQYFNPRAVVPNEGGSKKERIKKALNELSDGKDPRKISAIYIGDAIGDILAVGDLKENDDFKFLCSVAVGVHIDDINLKRKNRDKLIQAGADFYINKISDLPKILNERR